jgi:translation initiation factor 2 subunit 2
MKYEQLLDRVYERMPKKTASGERFEPPQFFSFVQGSQTFVKNFSEVANVLRRDPQHLLKFLSKELAAPGNFDGKRAMLQGKFKDEQLNARLKVYIAEYVLCKECNKPDTDIVSHEGVKQKCCEVCGARAPVKAI